MCTAAAAPTEFRSKIVSARYHVRPAVPPRLPMMWFCFAACLQAEQPDVWRQLEDAMPYLCEQQWKVQYRLDSEDFDDSADEFANRCIY